MNKVTFTKSDILLWPSKCQFITKDMLESPESFVLMFPSGRELAFQGTKDGRALKPNRDSSGYREWLDLPYGSVVEAELV